MEDRVVFQMDQTEPQSENVSWHISQCCSHPTLDCPLCVSSPGIPEIQVSVGTVFDANTQVTAT